MRVRIAEWLLNRGSTLLHLAGLVNGVRYEIKLVHLPVPPPPGIVRD